MGKNSDNGRKISKNLIMGISSEILAILLGIIVPRLVLTSYGSEINGLLSSVTQVYSYIALLEAGIGVATVQALYKTIGRKNRDETNAVLAATNEYYHKTGIGYLLAILAFSIIYPIVVKSEIPTHTIILVIIFNGAGSVISYFFQAKFFLLLEAEGKNYVKTSLAMLTNVFKNIAKIVLMSMGADVVFVQMISMVISLFQMIFVTWYIRKYYPWIDLRVKPDCEAISQSKNVLVHQVSGLVYHNTDAITLTVFCGLKTVSIYSMYTLLFSMISTALSTFSSSFIFSLGQAFHVDRDKFMKMYDAYELFYVTLVFSLYSVANFFILPFMKLYTNGVNDVNYIDSLLPVMFILTYLLSCGRSAPNQAINFAGHFKKTQNRAIAEAVINLVVSVIAVQFCGIYGVLIGTIVALLYRSNDIILYASKNVLKRSPIITYKRWGVNLGVFALMMYFSKMVTIELNTYVKIFAFCVPYTLVTLLVFFGTAFITERVTASYLFQVLKDKFKGRLLRRGKCSFEHSRRIK